MCWFKNEYYIVGNRPVKFITDFSGMDILAYDWKKKTFVRDMSYLSKVFSSEEVEQVSKWAFNAYVKKLKTEK